MPPAQIDNGPIDGPLNGALHDALHGLAANGSGKYEPVMRRKVAHHEPRIHNNIGTRRATSAVHDFDLSGKVFIVTGGARGLGLAMAEAVIQAGATVFCIDCLPEPDLEFLEAQKRAAVEEVDVGGDGLAGGALHYVQLDVRDSASLHAAISRIAQQHGRLDGLVAAAGIQHVKAAIDYTAEEASRMMAVNYTGVLMTAQAVAKTMIAHGCCHGGSIVLVASISGLVANKGLVCPVYNSSKAAVIQLARNLAMEWGPMGLRVNALCPGHILTPMVRENFRDDPRLQKLWERENMLGRLSEPREFRGAALFLLGDASSFMTGASLVIDGGHTAW